MPDCQGRLQNHRACGAAWGLALIGGHLVAWVEAEARNRISHGHVLDLIGFDSDPGRGSCDVFIQPEWDSHI